MFDHLIASQIPNLLLVDGLGGSQMASHSVQDPQGFHDGQGGSPSSQLLVSLATPVQESDRRQVLSK